MTRLLDSDGPRLVVSPVTAHVRHSKAARELLPPPPDSLSALASVAGYDELPATIAAANVAARLPLEHRNPWDLLLAGRAIANGQARVGADPEIRKLGVQTVW